SAGREPQHRLARLGGCLARKGQGGLASGRRIAGPARLARERWARRAGSLLAGVVRRATVVVGARRPVRSRPAACAAAAVQRVAVVALLADIHVAVATDHERAVRAGEIGYGERRCLKREILRRAARDDVAGRDDGDRARVEGDGWLGIVAS